MIAIQDGYLMKEYLELRRKSGFLYQKNWKHIFISGELRGLSANNGTSLYEVYSTLEFQLHAHSVFFEFSSGDCLGAKPSSDCRIDGFYFDSFGSYRAVYYLVYRPLLPVSGNCTLLLYHGCTYVLTHIHLGGQWSVCQGIWPEKTSGVENFRSSRHRLIISPLRANHFLGLLSGWAYNPWDFKLY